MAKKATASRESVAYQDTYYAATAPQQMPKKSLRVVSSRKKKRVRALRVQQLTCFAVVLAIIGVVLYSQMTLTRLTREVSQKQVLLENLENEYVALKAQRDRALSLDYVEEYAHNQLGMVKMDSGQVEYIEMNNPDRIEVSQQTTGLGGVFSGLAKSFSAILEYLQ